MVTCVGKFLRMLRISKGEILKNMADRLGVSSAFLSAVENGKKKFPVSWHEKITKYYNLSPQQIDELKQAVLESSDIIELNLQGLSAQNRQLAVSFARQFGSLDEETNKKIYNILNQSKNK